MYKRLEQNTSNWQQQNVFMLKTYRQMTPRSVVHQSAINLLYLVTGYVSEAEQTQNTPCWGSGFCLQ